MSTSLPSPSRSTLNVTAEPGTELTVLDHGLSVVRRGAGRLDLDLPPGLYKVIARSADRADERFVELTGTVPRVSVDFAPIEFASAAPLGGTYKTHEYQVGAAYTHSRGQGLPVGRGGQLFLFSRYWRDRDPGRGPDPSLPHPARGMTLATIDGAPIADVPALGQSDMNVPDPWSALLLELDPGAYRLRVTSQAIGTVEQTVVICPGWQTQVFTLVRDLDVGPAVELGPDTSLGAILMARIGTGFEYGERELRLTEVLRDALARGRSPADQRSMSQVLDAKFANPMFGLLGAHVLWLSQDPDPGLLSAVLGNVRCLIGDHPDLQVLEMARPGSTDRGPIAVPPMLANSWNVLVGLGDETTEVVPEDSLVSRIAGARWGNGAWLTWLLDEVETGPEMAVWPGQSAEPPAPEIECAPGPLDVECAPGSLDAAPDDEDSAGGEFSGGGGWSFPEALARPPASAAPPPALAPAPAPRSRGDLALDRLREMLRDLPREAMLSREDLSINEAAVMRILAPPKRPRSGVARAEIPGVADVRRVLSQPADFGALAQQLNMPRSSVQSVLASLGRKIRA
jgi:hypothetical protein